MAKLAYCASTTYAESQRPRGTPKFAERTPRRRSLAAISISRGTDGPANSASSRCESRGIKRLIFRSRRKHRVPLRVRRPVVGVCAKSFPENGIYGRTGTRRCRGVYLCAIMYARACAYVCMRVREDQVYARARYIFGAWRSVSCARCLLGVCVRIARRLGAASAMHIYWAFAFILHRLKIFLDKGANGVDSGSVYFVNGQGRPCLGYATINEGVDMTKRITHAAYTCSGVRGDKHDRVILGRVYSRDEADKMPDNGPACPVCKRMTVVIDYTLLSGVFSASK